MYFASGTLHGPQSLADWIARTGTIVVDVCQPPDLIAAARMMGRYRDTPMDFADATLVIAAELLDVVDIFTLDRRGFSTFRTSQGKPFNLVLDAA
jgi:predicted nucleic acid-binding protein